MAAKDAEDVFRNTSCDHLRRLFSGQVAVHQVEGPREHALADKGGVRLGVVVRVDCVISVVARCQLGAALGDGLDAEAEVDDADCVGVVDGHRVNVQRLGVPGKAIHLGLPVECVVNLDCVSWLLVSKRRRPRVREKTPELVTYDSLA
jgi:hypothetical protein